MTDSGDSVAILFTEEEAEAQRGDFLTITVRKEPREDMNLGLSNPRGST